MSGLRIYVADAENREMALDKIDVEIKWIVGLDKSNPACTLLVYPPALFERRDANDECNVPLCELEDYSEDQCAGFDGFMSLAMDAREMAQGFNAAHGQDIDTETLYRQPFPLVLSPPGLPRDALLCVPPRRYQPCMAR